MRTLVHKLILPFTVVGALLLGASPALAHTVEKGDTLGNIAYDNGVSVNHLLGLNPHIKDMNLIYVGEHIETTGTKAVTKASTPVKPVKAESVDAVSASQSEQATLAKLVEAEARDESYTGKVAVAEVVLNRVKHNTFPDTINEVIYQQGQFSPVSNGAINTTASQDSKKAVAEAMNGSNLTDGALFFWNPSIASNRWLESKITTTVIGNHEFKK